MSKESTNSTNLLPWITTLLMVSGIAVIAAFYWNQNITIQKVKINELYFATEQEVYHSTQNALGVKPDSIDFPALVKKIEQLQYVKSVQPYVEPNGSLKLTITEREPLALLIDGSNRFYVDAEGVVLPILEHKYRNVPLLYGYDTSLNDTLSDQSFLQVRDFLLYAKENGLGWITISEIAFDEIDGVVALSHENGVKLLFGRNDFETKLENWEAFYTQVIKTKGIDAMQQVDLRFTNQVVTREI